MYIVQGIEKDALKSRWILTPFVDMFWRYLSMYLHLYA